MNTEITDNRNGWIFFDAECSLCTNLAQRISWTRPLYWLLDVPIVRSVLGRVYRCTARHRTCLGGGCRIAVRSERFGLRGLRWIPATVLPILTVVSGKNLPEWVWMWFLAVALFLGGKWITIWPMLPTKKAARGRLLVYLLLWPGMAMLPTFIRRLFWVYYAFIGLCLVSFGCLTFALAGTLAEGSILARALCVFFAAFWTMRLVAATFLFDLSPYLTNVYRRVGYHVINIVFIYLPVVYLLAAWQGGQP